MSWEQTLVVSWTLPEAITQTRVWLMPGNIMTIPKGRCTMITGNQSSSGDHSKPQLMSQSSVHPVPTVVGMVLCYGATGSSLWIGPLVPWLSSHRHTGDDGGCDPLLMSWLSYFGSRLHQEHEAASVCSVLSLFYSFVLIHEQHKTRVTSHWLKHPLKEQFTLKLKSFSPPSCWWKGVKQRCSILLNNHRTR